MEMKTVRLRVAELLKARGMTQRQLAAELDMSTNAVSKLVAAPRQIRLDTIGRLCEVLDVQVEQLFEVREQ